MRQATLWVGPYRRSLTWGSWGGDSTDLKWCPHTPSQSSTCSNKTEAVVSTRLDSPAPPWLYFTDEYSLYPPFSMLLYCYWLLSVVTMSQGLSMFHSFRFRLVYSWVKMSLLPHRITELQIFKEFHLTHLLIVKYERTEDPSGKRFACDHRTWTWIQPPLSIDWLDELLCYYLVYSETR